MIFNKHSSINRNIEKITDKPGQENKPIEGGLCGTEGKHEGESERKLRFIVKKK